MIDLSPILLPVIVSIVISVSGAWVLSRFSSPAQQAYVSALTGRLDVVTKERDDFSAKVKSLELRINFLEQQVSALQKESDAKDREITELYRRIEHPSTARQTP